MAAVSLLRPLCKKYGKLLVVVALATTICLSLYQFIPHDRLTIFLPTNSVIAKPFVPSTEETPKLTQVLAQVEDLAQYFTDFPVTTENKQAFGELGRRTQTLDDWLAWAETLSPGSSDRATIERAIDQVAASQYPYFRRSEADDSYPLGRTPLFSIRVAMRPGTTGIVIPAGEGNLRFAAHLILALRNVHRSALPIQVAYAGDKDLSPASRDRLLQVLAAGVVTEVGGETTAAAKMKRTTTDKAALGVEFLDVTTFFDTESLRLDAPNGGWAIKPFAALASAYETVIVLDADAVFMQAPEALLRQQAFQQSGTLLFHDRLLWQHAFGERHAWYQDQIRRPSLALHASRVWMEDYAEEGDSGVVVLDKSRRAVWASLLHICWQNSYEVREKVTYRMTYGDKESWWLGLELVGVPYRMEQHYGGMIGWEEGKDGGGTGETAKTKEAKRTKGLKESKKAKGSKGNINKRKAGKPRVCSFAIAHVDEDDRLLWYNGSLLKNKAVNDSEYATPDSWMIDGDWVKGATKRHMSCMEKTAVRQLTESETALLRQSIEGAMKVDELLEKGA